MCNSNSGLAPTVGMSEKLSSPKKDEQFTNPNIMTKRLLIDLKSLA